MAAFEPIPYLHGLEVPKAELAIIVGEPLSAIDTWVRQGCPCRRTGAVRSLLMFDTAQALAWHRIEHARREGDDYAARMVRLAIEKEALEAEVARLRG